MVLNDEDVINAVFYDSPASTFLNFQDPVDDNRHWLDKLTDHFIDGTYLNAYGSKYDSSNPNSLFSLKEFTLKSILDTAALLESNCPKAYINQSITDLIVKYDAKDPNDPHLEDLKYIWEFGDGSKIETTSKEYIHTYRSSGSFTVKLRVTDSFDSDFGKDASAEKNITIGGQAIGCGSENGRYHINPDGTIGGFVSNSATVSSLSTISPIVKICGNSQVLGRSSIIAEMDTGYPGFTSNIVNSTIIDSSLKGPTIDISNATISNSNISAESWLMIGNSTVDGITANMYSIAIAGSKVINSQFSCVGVGDLSISQSEIINSNFRVEMYGIYLSGINASGKTLDVYSINSSNGYLSIKRTGIDYGWSGPYTDYPYW